MDSAHRILWRVGWNPNISYALIGCLALVGWLLFQHPAGLLLCIFGILPHWNAIGLINTKWQEYVGKAESIVKEQGAHRVGVTLDKAAVTVARAGRGFAPVGATPRAEYVISVVYICDSFFAVYQDAVLSLASLTVELPVQGEEVYFRHVSAVRYNPPNIEVVLSSGKSMRKFDVGPEGNGAVLGALRAKLRQESAEPTESTVVSSPTDNLTAAPDSASNNSTEKRYCYLRAGKLEQLLADPLVLDVLVEQLEVPGAPKTLKQLTSQAKMQSIEAQIDHFRRTPTSVWYGVPVFEVMAASLWRTNDDQFYRDKGLLSRKLVRREWFSGVSEEDDLRVPIAKWLKKQDYEPYMEIPLGSARVDVLGCSKPGLLNSRRFVAVELKNDYEQFKRALNQMSTFAEYTNAVYMACTPDFAAEYSDRQAESTGHWNAEALERKIIGGGFGLLIVEKERVSEVVKPTERTPSEVNHSSVTGALSAVRIIEC